MCMCVCGWGVEGGQGRVRIEHKGGRLRPFDKGHLFNP